MKTKINGIEIDYRDEGSGVPVVFIHAFPLNQTMWDDQFRELRRHCRAITLDLRGFGQSEAPPGPYSLDEMAADVHGLMSTLDIEEAVLVGLSMGGYIALAFYHNYPDSVRAMVLADTRASGDTNQAQQRRLKSAERVERDGISAIADDMVPLLLGSTSLEARPSIVERVRLMIEGNSAHGIANAQRAMAARRDSTYLLKELNLPVLVITGSEDKLTNVVEAEGMRAGITGARLKVIQNAGHLSNLECPDGFNNVLLEFIGSV